MGGIEVLKDHPFFSENDFKTKWGHLFDVKSPLEANKKFNSRPTKA